MAIPAAVVTAAKKLIIQLLTKKKTWVMIASFLTGIVLLVLFPAIVLFSLGSGISAFKLGDENVLSNLTSEQSEELQYLKTVVTAVNKEIGSQGLEVDPVKVEVIYMLALRGKEQDDDEFYKDFASCFAAEDDEKLFVNISERFEVTFTAEDIDKILSLYEKVAGSS